MRTGNDHSRSRTRRHGVPVKLHFLFFFFFFSAFFTLPCVDDQNESLEFVNSNFKWQDYQEAHRAQRSFPSLSSRAMHTDLRSMLADTRIHFEIEDEIMQIPFHRFMLIVNRSQNFFIHSSIRWSLSHAF